MLNGAVLLAALGCGGEGGVAGGGGDGNKTFQGDRYTFTYPGAWAEQAGDVTTGRVDVVVAPPEGGRNLVALTVLRDDAVLEPVTKSNIDQAVQDLRPAVDALMQRANAVLKGNPTQVTYAGLPGLRFEASSTGPEAVHMQGTWLFDGTTAYTFTCQFVPSGAEEVGQACDLVLESFQISD